MNTFYYEFRESVRIAFAQITAHKMRSVLTALGVIIGIVAVTLMGMAITGMDTSFESSLAMLGDDVIYVQKWPWGPVDDWWNYTNRPPLQPIVATELNKLIDAAPSTLLDVAVPVRVRSGTVKRGDNSVGGVYMAGTSGDYGRIITADFREGRLFTETEAESARAVCVLGCDVADALFTNVPAVGQTIQVRGYPFQVIGVLARQGSFLGLFSFDTQMILPIKAFEKDFGGKNRGAEIRVKVKDKKRLEEAKEELIGLMRRVRGQLPGESDNFSINGEEAFKQQLDPVKKGIAIAGLFVTGLALFVGAIGIMNITFVSVKERTKEIGTRKALGAKRRTILLQFLIESISVSVIGGIVGIILSSSLCLLIGHIFPKLPISFSPVLVVVSLLVSAGTGIVAGFAPAWGASRLDPVVALRYE
ncbi:MAG: ABC transporter permease [Verrucomicrobiota bacterium]